MTRRLSGPRREAKSGKATSLVIFLHGYGADGEDLIGIGDTLADHLPNTRFLAPNAPEKCANNPFGYQWFSIPWLDGSTEESSKMGLAQASVDLNAHLDEVAATEGISADRTVVVGFSQGTMMSLHVLPGRDEQVAGIVGFSGRLIDPPSLKNAVSKPPVLLVHGDQDPMVPVQSLSDAADALVENGFETYTHISKGVGHGIAPDGLGLALQFIRDRIA